MGLSPMSTPFCVSRYSNVSYHPSGSFKVSIEVANESAFLVAIFELFMKTFVHFRATCASQLSRREVSLDELFELVDSI